MKINLKKMVKMLKINKLITKTENKTTKKLFKKLLTKKMNKTNKKKEKKNNSKEKISRNPCLPDPSKKESILLLIL
jgi:hypothetical protein